MPDAYVPRGYVSTRQAVDRLFEERHSDLAANRSEREAEMRTLCALKSALRSTLGPIERHRALPLDNGDSTQPGFSAANEERLKVLSAMEKQERSERAVAARDIRTALAEGDFAAILVTDYGHEAAIPISRWRANDALQCVRKGQIEMQLPTATMGTSRGRAFIKGVDFTVWLSKHVPKPFSQVGITISVKNPLGTEHRLTTTVLPTPATAEKAAPTLSGNELPFWLTLMEAVAWIVSRQAQIVDYASPERNTIRSFVIDHVLPNGKRVSGEVELPPGISLLWLDLFAAQNDEEPTPTDRAISELIGALRSGRILARAIWAATGERRDMGADEWRELALDTPPRDARTLLPHKVFPGLLATKPETRWREVLLPRNTLLALWPASDGGCVSGTLPRAPINALSGRQIHDPQGTAVESGASVGPRRDRPPPVAEAALARWYIHRRDQWPEGRKHPSQDEDLADARWQFPDHSVTRPAVRAVRAQHAPASWTFPGRRKLAQK